MIFKKAISKRTTPRSCFHAYLFPFCIWNADFDGKDEHISF